MDISIKIMQITSTKFIKSSPDLKSCPKEGLPEYAFSGRSNVGKSSLLNYLTNSKNLAKTSSTPGKTRYINHYLINDNWYMVDLPGYGYARTDKSKRALFMLSVNDYLLHRNSLACLFILIDSRHKPLQSDLDFINFAGQNGVPFAIIFTKADKLSFTALNKNIDNYKKFLLKDWEELPEIFSSSSLNHTGRESILGFIERTNNNYFNK